MADNGRWFKLWVNSITDNRLASLPNELWAVWAKFGTYVKCHGQDGEITLTKPEKMLCSIMQCDSFECLINAIKCFPNVTVSLVTNDIVSYKIKYENWFKYQGDFSTDRVKKFRAKNRKSETPKKRREEKRREENKSNGKFIPPTIEEVSNYCLEKSNGVDPKKWFHWYKSNGWKVGKNPMKDWKAAVSTWERKGESLADQYREL